jgi:hypothetical protein
MSQMNAVEIAHGDDRALVRIGNIAVVAKDAHPELSLCAAP